MKQKYIKIDSVWENVPFNTKNHFISCLLVEVFLYKDSLSLSHRTLFQTRLLVASCLARWDQVTLLKLVWLRLKHGNCTDLLESLSLTCWLNSNKSFKEHAKCCISCNMSKFSLRLWTRITHLIVFNIFCLWGVILNFVSSLS